VLGARIHDAVTTLIEQARTAARHAAFEPPFLMNTRLSGWRRVLDSLDTLLTRVACLESALEGATGEGQASGFNTSGVCGLRPDEKSWRAAHLLTDDLPWLCAWLCAVP